jgi:hypothetical protein
VGNDPYAVPLVSGTKVGSWDTMPFCIIPDLMEVLKHSVQSSIAKGGDVFNDNPFWFDFLDKPLVVLPIARTFSFYTSTFTGQGDVLTREPTSDHINLGKDCQSIQVIMQDTTFKVDKVCNIRELRYTRPMLV